jgi:hypothetical protein
MTELKDKATISKTTDLDDSALLGFEWLEPSLGEVDPTEQVGLAFNRRGIEGEGGNPP